MPVFKLTGGASNPTWKSKYLGRVPGVWFKMLYPSKEFSPTYDGEYRDKIGQVPLETTARAPTVLEMLCQLRRRPPSEYVHAYGLREIRFRGVRRRCA